MSATGLDTEPPDRSPRSVIVRPCEGTRYRCQLLVLVSVSELTKRTLRAPRQLDSGHAETHDTSSPPIRAPAGATDRRTTTARALRSRGGAIWHACRAPSSIGSISGSPFAVSGWPRSVKEP